MESAKENIFRLFCPGNNVPEKCSSILGIITATLLSLSFLLTLRAQETMLDHFNTTRGWEIHKSEGVTVDTAIVEGIRGNCLKMGIDFIQGTGYGGVRKRIPMELPQNFRFSFYLKSDLPVNNLEFKLVDESGENVWWEIKRNFDFPREWQQFTIRKRDIIFAWGPTADKTLRQVNTFEFIVSSATGGKGSVYIDEFSFEPLAVPDTTPPYPIAAATSRLSPAYPVGNILDGTPKTSWHSVPSDSQEILLDFQKHHEFGGIVIDWDSLDYAVAYRVLLSDNHKQWNTAYTVYKGGGNRRYLMLPNGEARYIKVHFIKSSRGKGYGIRDIRIAPLDFSRSPNAFFAHLAGEAPRGVYPRYFYNEQSYWTAIGVNGDRKEALINEEGMVEVDKSRFSLEPFLFVDGHLITWNDVKLIQELEQGYLPIPRVRWNAINPELTIQAFTNGNPVKSTLYIGYRVRNTGNVVCRGNLYIAIRPFQVNPPWQNLNWEGGVARIKSLTYHGGKVTVNGEQVVRAVAKGMAFGALKFDEGLITDWIAKDQLPNGQQVTDHTGYASGAFRYPFNLQPGDSTTLWIMVPFYPAQMESYPVHSARQIESRLCRNIDSWQSVLNRFRIELPPSVRSTRFLNSLRANLAYILINRDSSGIQPGSRSYERSWIRDGALSSSALLKFNIRQEVREFLDWYSTYQYANGKIPCVVDRRGPDPTPENDSHGEYIFAVMEYFRFTRDTTFLKAHYSNVQKAVQYMEELIRQRVTEPYRYGPPVQQACYGLFPESISHEGYSARPMHSYWDDFWGVKGFKDAVTMARILGDQSQSKHWEAALDSFRASIYRSIRSAVKIHQIDFIPGSVELGDFDATSTAIAIYPCGELAHLPEPYATNTFDRYYRYFRKRLQPSFQWTNYTPYELRLAGTFIYRGQPKRAQELFNFFFTDQRPPAWHHWAEVVRKQYRTPGFIGDMPHSWVGSEFINAFRSMLVYETGEPQTLVIGAGLYDDWLESPGGIRVTGLPTYFGEVSYTYRKTGSGYRVTLSGNLNIPEGGFWIRIPGSHPPTEIRINGKINRAFEHGFVVVREFPAQIEVDF